MVTGKTTASAPYPIEYDINRNVYYYANSAEILKCLATAKHIYENILDPSTSTNLKIKIRFDSRPMGWSSTTGGKLMETEPTIHNNDHGCPRTNTSYCQAINNFNYSKMTGFSAGNIFTGNDMVITFNQDVPWNYRLDIPCPAGKFDFVTILMHEIGHGLGLFSAAQNITSSGFMLGGTGAYAGNFPSDYDHFVNDNNTGSCAASPYFLHQIHLLYFSNLQSFCEGRGGYGGSGCAGSTNEVHFGTANDTWTGSTLSQISRLYAPTTFVTGRSISHTDIVGYSAAQNTDLMNPFTFPGNRFVPSIANKQMLEKLGWQVTWPVGFYGPISIFNGTTCSGAPNQVINIGTSNSYCSDPGSPAAFGTWNLILYADDGPHTALTLTGLNCSVNLTTLPTLSTGVNWNRDLNGRIRGALQFLGRDTWDGSDKYRGLIGVGVNYAPTFIEANVNNGSDYWCQCDKATISAFSEGATTYSVYKRARFFSGTWSAWSTAVVLTGGQSTHTYTGLNQYNDYQFQVVATNALGSVTSTILQRNRCLNYLQAAPNPVSATLNTHSFNVTVNPPGGGPDAVDYTDLECGPDANITVNNIGFNNILADVTPPLVNPCGSQDKIIHSITLVNIGDPNINYQFNYNGTSSTETVDVQNVVPGIYTMSVLGNNGTIGTKNIQVVQ